MILYCDFNPRMARVYEIDDLEKIKINVAENSREYVSGFGIDGVVFTRHLNENVKLLGFFGGRKGNFIKEDLQKQGVICETINILDENVEEIILKEIGGKTIIKTKSPRITIENQQEFITKFAQELDKVNIVCLTQTDQQGINTSLYELLIKMCYTRGVKVVVTVSEVQDIGKSKPYMLVLDKNQLEEYTNVILKNDEEITFAARGLIETGIGVLVIISLEGALIFTKESSFKASFNNLSKYITKINRNLMVSGITIGFERKYNIQTSIRLGLASAIIENFVKFRLVSMADIKKIMNEIEIYSI